MRISETKLENHTLITFEEGFFKVVLSTFGASFIQIRNKEDELIYSPIDIDSIFKPSYYYGKTIGQICNRIEKGIVHIGNKVYQMLLNEGNNTLHGGVNGLPYKNFDYEIDKANSSITFKYNKKSFEDGLPGNISYQIKYVVNPMEIQMFYDAVSDEDTVISLTNHVHFCLKDKDVTKFCFQGEFNKYVVPGKEDLLPKGIESIPYYLDFSNKLCLGKYLFIDELQNHRAKGYDHNLIFKKGLGKHIVFLEDSSYELQIESDYPSVQIYTDNYENEPIYKDMKLSRYGAVSIEQCDILCERPLMKKGEHYLKKVKYTIKEK